MMAQDGPLEFCTEPRPLFGSGKSHVCLTRKATMKSGGCSTGLMTCIWQQIMQPLFLSP